MVKRIRNFFEGLYFMGPSVIVYLACIAVPFVYSLVISTAKWDGLSKTIKWVGLQNYSKLMKDKAFWSALWFSARSTIAIVIISNILGLLFAVLITSISKPTGFAQTTILMPNIMSGVILGFIWKFIFNTCLPALGNAFGIDFLQESWLGTPVSAFWSIVLVSVWQWSGYTMIIYIAGLTQISKDLIEASIVDGANPFQTFFRIKLPLIMPSITICLFWTISRSIAMFDLPFSLTEGGPFRTTRPVAMDLYFEAFDKYNYGMGSAKAVVFFILIFFISMAQVRSTRRQEVEL